MRSTTSVLLHSLNYGAAGVDTISGAWYLTGRCQSAKCDRWLTWSVRVKFSPDLSSGRGESHPPAPEVGIMNDARLHDRHRPHRVQRVRQPFQPIADHEEHIRDAPVLQVGQHSHPEIRG